MASLSQRQRRALARAAVGASCWDAPIAIAERVDKLCASDGYTGKYITRTVESVANNATVSFRFTAPGAFCPKRMFVFFSNSVTGAPLAPGLSAVGLIQVGLENQILGPGPKSVGQIPFVPAQMFSIENFCCPVFCPPCLCAPQVPLELQVGNATGSTADITVVLLGEYVDVPPDQFQFNQPSADPSCCPPPSSDKLMGFANALAAGESKSIVLTASGRFCPRQLFLALVGTTGNVVIDGIRSGLDETLITGPIPMQLFTIDNKCCILMCIDCICMPGYPITIDVRNTHPELGAGTFGALVGCYEDACPPGM